MTSSSEKDTSLKPESLSEVRNVAGLMTVYTFWRLVFELDSYCEKKEDAGTPSASISFFSALL